MIINEGRPGKKLPTLTNPGVAGDLLSGKQLIGQDGNIITGTIPSKASTDISVSGRTVTVPAGYYPSQASKSIASATQATPSITVSTGGLITASATQSAGYVASGTKSATKQLTTQAGKTVTPGTSQQTAVASGRYTTGTVYVAGDSDLKAENIKKGVAIFGVTGTMSGAPVPYGYTYETSYGSDTNTITFDFMTGTNTFWPNGTPSSIYIDIDQLSSLNYLRDSDIIAAMLFPSSSGWQVAGVVYSEGGNRASIGHPTTTVTISGDRVTIKLQSFTFSSDVRYICTTPTWTI